MSRVVARVDHIVLESGNEDALFDFFHGTLGLPVAWPMAQWGDIYEGGINVGNCNIGCNRKFDPKGPDEARIAAVAFEPFGGLDRALHSLDQLGLDHTEPLPSGRLDDAPQPWNAGWTNSLILRPRPLSFLCEYHHDVDARRRASEQAFVAHDNPFGITGVEGVWCNTTDFSGWGALLGDERLPGPWIAQDDSIGAGVDLDKWWGLYLRVESLERAAEAASSDEFSIGMRRSDGGPWEPHINHRVFNFIEFVDAPVW